MFFGEWSRKQIRRADDTNGEKLLTIILWRVLQENVYEGSGMKQALQSAVQEAGVACVVEAAANGNIARPVCINGTRIEGFGRRCSNLCSLQGLHRRGQWGFLRLSRLLDALMDG